jgi:hypothetical protein
MHGSRRCDGIEGTRWMIAQCAADAQESKEGWSGVIYCSDKQAQHLK